MSIRGPASQSMPPRSDAVSPESGLPIQVRRDVHATGLEGSLSSNLFAHLDKPLRRVPPPILLSRRLLLVV